MVLTAIDAVKISHQGRTGASKHHSSTQRALNRSKTSRLAAGYLETVQPRLSKTAVASRTGMTVVELLVVVSIIVLLAAILMPALNTARESARQTVCKENLRQIGLGLMQFADTNNGKLCSGAFDWVRDGAVTEVGWVADLVKREIPVGELLCPTSPHRISETYDDLLNADASGFNVTTCLDRLGSEPEVQPDGSTYTNPCRKIHADGLSPGSAPRRKVVKEQIYDKYFNTNYSASWYLVRSGVRIDNAGNLDPEKPGCGASLKGLNATDGPLDRARTDAGKAPASFIPLMGDGAPAGILTNDIGEAQIGTFFTRGFTDGPVRKDTLVTPTFPSGTSMTGATGWWAVWHNEVLQDYRAFEPLHRGQCNVLFADASVRSLTDKNEDRYLNNGFPASAASGFKSSEVEIPEEDVYSGWSLMSRKK